jgi:hypothetical protein
MAVLLRKLFKLADADLAAGEDRSNFQPPTQRFDVFRDGAQIKVGPVLDARHFALVYPQRLGQLTGDREQGTGNKGQGKESCHVLSPACSHPGSRSQHPQKGRRCDDGYPAKRMQAQEIVITGHNGPGLRLNRALQDSVVVGIVSQPVT